MAKIWQKDSGQLHPVIEKYEVGSDWIYDGKLFKYELAATGAHAEMLGKIGILSADELAAVRKEIKRLYRELGDTIELKVEDEDIHSKLENLLTAVIGETGKKIHTGRSRNDQVRVVMRLFEKDQLLDSALVYCDFLNILLDFIEKEGKKILPGYTHTKQAMLMTAGMWAGAFVELGLDNLRFMKNVLSQLDSNPLGSGSGFGVPVPLDREMTTKLLGFSRVQMNPMAVQNSCGKFESMLIDCFWNIMNDFSRMASDMLMFNMDELLYIKTTTAITTGSSIMPQKRNLDVMELVRGRTGMMLAYSNTVKNLVTGIISGYNRDQQETKEPVFKALGLVQDTIEAVTVVFENIEFDESAVKKCLSKGIFATDIAFQAVGQGMPFRDAYKLAAKKMEEIEVSDAVIKDSLEKRVSPGSPKTVKASDYRKILAESRSEFEKERIKMDNCFIDLLE